MINPSYKSSNQKLFSNTILKIILPFVLNNNQWCNMMTYLGRLSYFVYAPNLKRDKIWRCIECQQQMNNCLLLILHLQFCHNQHLQVIRYELSPDTLTIHIQKGNFPNKQYIKPLSKNDSYMTQTLTYRVQSSIERIIKKIKITHQINQRIYFHSNDIFRPISQDSFEFDSEQQVGHIQRQLQRIRISDFNDVNTTDKMFFLEWNNAISESKKKKPIIDHDTMLQILKQFAYKASGKNIPRINLVMHMWTLWSVGQIDSSDVIKVLEEYNRGVN